MSSRVGQCYLLDHGGGHETLRLVVGRQATDLLDGEVAWQLVVFDLLRGVSWQRTDPESTLAYWDDCSGRCSNIRRIAP